MPDRNNPGLAVNPIAASSINCTRSRTRRARQQTVAIYVPIIWIKTLFDVAMIWDLKVPIRVRKTFIPTKFRLEAESDDKVSFFPFMGISPYRYRDLFKKSDRKARDWYLTDMRPMVDMVVPA